MTDFVCATCGEAVVVYSTPPLWRTEDGVSVGEESHVWTHAARPEVEHAPVPVPARQLLCTKCHNPLVSDDNGWHCESPGCISSPA